MSRLRNRALGPLTALAALGAFTCLGLACSSSNTPASMGDAAKPGTDAGHKADVGTKPPVDAGVDAKHDVKVTPPTDAGVDAKVDTGTGVDARQDVTADVSTTGTATVTGTITDLTGIGVAGVTVAYGSTSVTTDASGAYKLTGLPAQANLVLSYASSAYLPTSEVVRTVSGATTVENVVMAAIPASLSLNASSGGTITGPRGASLTAGPGAFVTASGAAVTGTVDVYLLPLDPAVPNQLAAYPGSLVGESSTGAILGLLATYGVMNVTVQQNGQDLQIASGQTVTVTLPGTAAGTLPASSDFWSFDTTTGVWKQEGTATLSGTTYSLTLPHLSWWNIDQLVPGGGACLKGQVAFPAGYTGHNATISSTGINGSVMVGNYQGDDLQTSATSDYCVWAPPSSSVALTVYIDGDGGFVQGFTGYAIVDAGAAISYTTDCTQVLPQCQNVGTIAIQSSDAAVPECLPDPGDAATDANLYAGTCMAPFWDAIRCCGAFPPYATSCYQNSTNGTWTYNSGTTVVYPGENPAELVCYSPTGQLCGTVSVLPGDGGDTTFEVSVPGGGTFVIPGKESGLIVCPNGQPYGGCAGYTPKLNCGDGGDEGYPIIWGNVPL